MAEERIHVLTRIKELKTRAAKKYGITPDQCHIGHVALQAMNEDPQAVHQIDAANDKRETNESLVYRSTRLANAMTKYGLAVGDPVAIIGSNTLDLAIPYFACHYNGYPMCAMDPTIPGGDIGILFSVIKPKLVFCPQSKQENVNEAIKNNGLDISVIVTDDEKNNISAFVRQHDGTGENFKPALFDPATTTAWLMLTSGTTGLPKVAIVTYDSLLTAVAGWWKEFTKKIHITMAMATIQWMSSLVFFISTPIMKFTRVQSSVPLTPQLLIGLINKYKPNATAWTPHMLGQFINAAGNYCDLSSFVYIAIGGSSIEKELLDRFRKKCDAYLYLVYGMTELLGPVFDYNEQTPFGAVGKEYENFQYRIVNVETGKDITENNLTGELWIKGENTFFKGYLNNPEETNQIITDDGWVKTGDIFYKDDDGNYHFVERLRLLIKFTGSFLSPLKMEETVKKHPGVADVCITGIPHPSYAELPVAAIIKNPGAEVDPNEIFNLFNDTEPEIERLHGGLFFMDEFPTTPSGKVHRAKIRELAFITERIPQPQQ